MPPVFRSHVLVVDDDPGIHEALTAALGDLHVVHSAASGSEACAWLRTQPIAAIILDAILGDEQGLDFVARFRALSPAPILLFTGYGSEELANRAIWAGVNGYLKKPVDLHQVRTATGRLVPQTDGMAVLAGRARQYLDAHLAAPVRSAEVARQLGASEMHLRRCFRATYGKTPRRYLTEVRMQQATVLLRTTARGVEQIALEVGYPSSTVFGKVFRRLFRVTPSEYRANRKEQPE